MAPQIRELCSATMVRVIHADELNARMPKENLNDIEVDAFAEVLRALAPQSAILDACDVNAERFGQRVAAKLTSPCVIVSKHEADAMLEKARFNGFSDKPVGEFSGGMLQRLGLAVAALPNAPILLLDEPTAHLDPQGVRRFREFILEQKELRKTIIFSTHLLAEAEQLADRVGIFVGGKLAAQESVENLRRAFHASGGSIEDMYLQYVGEQGND